MSNNASILGKLDRIKTTKEGFRTNFQNLYENAYQAEDTLLPDSGTSEVIFENWPALFTTGKLKTTSIVLTPDSANNVGSVTFSGIAAQASGYYQVTLNPMAAGEYNSASTNSATGIATSNSVTDYYLTSTGTSTITESGWIHSGNKTSNATTYIQAASITLGGSKAAITPTIAIGTDNIASMAVVSSQPTSGYYALISATAPSTTITPTKTIIEGYLKNSNQFSGSATINATSKNYYLPIQSAVLTANGPIVSVSTEGYSDTNLSATVNSGLVSGATPIIDIDGLTINATAPAPIVNTAGWVTSSETEEGTDGSYQITDLTIDDNITLLWTYGTVTSNDLIPANIRSGKTILGVTGTVDAEMLLNEDQNNANLENQYAGYLLTGYSAYDENANFIVGTMSNFTGSTINASSTASFVPIFESNSSNILSIWSNSTGYLLKNSTKITAAVPNASNFLLSITDNSSTNLIVGTASNGYYPFSTSLTGTFSASTKGYFGSGSATDSSTIVGRIVKAAGENTITGNNPASLKPAISKNSVTITDATNVGNTTTTTAPSSGFFVAVQSAQSSSSSVLSGKTAISTAGYAPMGDLASSTLNITANMLESDLTYMPINAGAGNVTLNAPSPAALKPSILNANGSNSSATNVGNTTTTTAPSSGFFVAVQSAGNTSTSNISADANISNAGWMPTDYDFTSQSSTVTATMSASDKTYMPINAGAGNVTLNAPSPDAITPDIVFSWSVPKSSTETDFYIQAYCNSDSTTSTISADANISNAGWMPTNYDFTSQSSTVTARMNGASKYFYIQAAGTTLYSANGSNTTTGLHGTSYLNNGGASAVGAKTVYTTAGTVDSGTLTISSIASEATVNVINTAGTVKYKSNSSDENFWILRKDASGNLVITIE